MSDHSRRDFLKYTGIATTTIGTVGAGTAAADNHNEERSGTVRGQLDLRGHASLDNPPGIYSNGVLRDDGQYGLLGGYYGEGGSFLVDLTDLENPTQAHRLPSDTTNRQNDVEFDPRDGLYYRTQEPNIDGGEIGFEVVDYGYGEGSVEDPTIIADVDTPRTGIHNFEAHPEESLLYVTDSDESAPGVLTYDVSDPTNPELIDEAGPDGSGHEVTVEVDRELLHMAYIGGFDGYVVFDISDPASPTELGRIDYANQPDYEEVGKPGFDGCHTARYDPERKLAVLSDETLTGIPGGKHIVDIGWDEGSPENPIPIGFTHSPNATEQSEDQVYFWTTHFHDIVPCGDTTLLVDGGYHEGVWVADITDPTDPVPSEQFQTLEGADRTEQLGVGPVAEFIEVLEPPFAWSAEYNAERDFVFASDSFTGAYVFDISAEPFEFRTIEEQLAQTFEPTDEIGQRELELARHYNEDHFTVPNTGGQAMTDEALATIEAQVDTSGGSGQAGQDETTRYYQVDLVEGEPIQKLGGQNGTYTDDQLIRFVHGSTDTPVIRRSDGEVTTDEDLADRIVTQDITILENEAITTFRITEGEPVTLTLATYEKPGLGWFPERESEQKFVDADTETVESGRHSLTVKLPGGETNTSD